MGGPSSRATCPPSVYSGRYMGAHSNMGRVVCLMKVSTTCTGGGRRGLLGQAAGAGRPSSRGQS